MLWVWFVPGVSMFGSEVPHLVTRKLGGPIRGRAEHRCLGHWRRCPWKKRMFLLGSWVVPRKGCCRRVSLALLCSGFLSCHVTSPTCMSSCCDAWCHPPWCDVTLGQNHAVWTFSLQNCELDKSLLYRSCGVV